MRKQAMSCLLLLGLAIMVGFALRSNDSVHVPSKIAQQIGLQIWRNECAGKLEGLTTWNAGEEFASLGIGHFIWYPVGAKGLFKETFPDLLTFFINQGIVLPTWLLQTKGCPWQTKEEFEAAKSGEELTELRLLLAQHVDLQIHFMAKRLQKALPTLLRYAPQDKRRQVAFQFYRLAQTSAGLYALLDYLNFKGEGIAPQESYQGQRWGLLQVLEKMQGTELGQPAIDEFVQSARQVLAQRIAHAPPERKEERWLKGWSNRLATYRSFNS